MRCAMLMSALAASALAVDAGSAQTPAGTTPPPETCGQSARHATTEENNKACLAAAGRLAGMHGQKLVLRMDDGSRKVFDSGQGDPNDDSFGYPLLDFYPDIHVFLVADVGVDDSKFTLVDGRTGEATKLGFAYPRYSPDRKWIFTFISHESDGDGPDIAVYDAGGPKPKKVWSLTSQQARLPADTHRAEWEDSATMRLSTGKGPRFVTRGTDGTWHLTAL